MKTILPETRLAQYETRNAGNLRLPKIKKNYLLKSFLPSTVKNWNSLGKGIKEIKDLEAFKQSIHPLYLGGTCYKPYLFGYTKEYINLSRIRMGLSGLNAHRKHYHFINFSTC